MQVIDTLGHKIGHFDGEIVSNSTGQRLYKIENNHIYSASFPKRLIGELESDVAFDIWGHVLFKIR